MASTNDNGPAVNGAAVTTLSEEDTMKVERDTPRAQSRGSAAGRSIATRSFLRGSLTAIQRIDTQLIDAMLLHAGGDVTHTDDHLNAAVYLASKLVELLAKARAALDNEQASLKAAA